jgi:alpha-L-arabinofuranosidase
MWDSWQAQPVPSATQAVSLIRPGVLRFPGGTLSDYYHWRYGVGPVSTLTKPTSLLGGPEMSYHGFGTDEALKLAAMTGSRLLLTVNVGTGTAQEAADWVRYVNTPTRRVVDWELGNELYAYTFSTAAARITIPPDVYAQKVKEFAQAMRAVDPGIRIGAIGGDCTVSNPSFTTPGASIVPQTTAPLLEAIASLNDTGSTAYLIVINKSLTSPLAANVRLYNVQTSGTVIVRTLRGTGIDAHTGTQLPGNVVWAPQTAARVNPRFPYSAPGEVPSRLRPWRFRRVLRTFPCARLRLLKSASAKAWIRIGSIHTI